MAGRFLGGWKWLPLLFFTAGVTVAFLTRHSYLHRGYWLDDYGFVAAGPLHLKDLPGIFSPDGIDWFYRPVFVVYARAMNSLFGGAGVPRHAMSLILFGLNAGAVGWFAARISGRASTGWLALALFMTMPGMEEAIWWFSSASTLIASLFSFLALIAWLDWRQGGSKATGMVAGVCMGIAMCAKEDVAALPLMLAVIDWACIPEASLKKRLARFAPLVAWACAWLVLDLLAYRHMISRVPATRLWHPDFVARLELAGSFCYRTLMLPLFADGAPMNGPLWMTALSAAVIVGWRIHRHGMLSALAICAVLSILPVPLATGGHVLSARFAFFPQAWASILGAMLVIQALHSPNRLTAMAGIAIASQWLFARLPIPRIDPFLVWIAMLLLAILALYLAVRVSPLRSAFLIASVAVCGAFVQTLLSDGSAGLCWAAVVIVSALIASRDAYWLDGIVCGTALLAYAPWTLPVYLFAPLLSLPRRRSWKAPRTPLTD